MEKRLSYILVGAFVLALSLSLAFFLYWLVKYGNEAKKMDYYYTYFTESVSGLNVESLVKLRGVEVGRVRSIKVNKKNSEEVEVLLEIIDGTPIKIDSFSTLDTQGITGLKYIELKGGTKNSPLLKTDDKNYAIIASQKSILSSIFDNGKSITEKIDNMLNKMDKILSQDNIDNFSKITSNLSATTTYFDENKQKFIEVLNQITDLKIKVGNDFDQIAQSFSKLSNKSEDFLESTKKNEKKITASFRDLSAMSKKVGIASDTTTKFFDAFGKKIDMGQLDIADIVEENLQILNETALSLRDLSINLDETIKNLKQSPSDLIYKSRLPKLGPGESNE